MYRYIKSEYNIDKFNELGSIYSDKINSDTYSDIETSYSDNTNNSDLSDVSDISDISDTPSGERSLFVPTNTKRKHNRCDKNKEDCTTSSSSDILLDAANFYPAVDFYNYNRIMYIDGYIDRYTPTLFTRLNNICSLREDTKLSNLPPIDRETVEYIKDIVKVYNELQSIYVKLLDNIRSELIKAGERYYSGDRTIIETQQIDYCSLLKLTEEELYVEMTQLKSNMKLMIDQIKRLYVHTKTKIPYNDTKRFDGYYKGVYSGLISLIPNTHPADDPVNKKLTDIFSFLGGGSSHNSSTSIRIMRGGSKSLNDLESDINDLRKRLDAFKQMLNPNNLDVSLLKKLSDKKRDMLLPSQQYEYEHDASSRNKKVYVDTFEYIDKNILVDSMTGLTDRGSVQDPNNTPGYGMKMINYDFKHLREKIKSLYKNSVDYLADNETSYADLKNTEELLRRFIDYDYSDLNRSDFTLQKDNMFTDVKREKIKTKLSVKDLEDKQAALEEKISRIHALSYEKAVDKFIVSAVKILIKLNKINGRSSMTFNQLYNEVKNSLNTDTYIKIANKEAEELIKLVEYFEWIPGKTQQDSLPKTHKIITPRYRSQIGKLFGVIVLNRSKNVYEVGMSSNYYNDDKKREDVKTMLQKTVVKDVTPYLAPEEMNKLKVRAEKLATTDKTLRQNTGSEVIGSGIFSGGDVKATDAIKNYIDSLNAIVNILSLRGSFPDNIDDVIKYSDTKMSGTDVSIREGLIELLSDDLTKISSLADTVDTDAIVSKYYKDLLSSTTSEVEEIKRSLIELKLNKTGDTNQQLNANKVDIAPLRIEIKNLLSTLTVIESNKSMIEKINKVIAEARDNVLGAFDFGTSDTSRIKHIYRDSNDKTKSSAIGDNNRHSNDDSHQTITTKSKNVSIIKSSTIDELTDTDKIMHTMTDTRDNLFGVINDMFDKIKEADEIKKTIYQITLNLKDMDRLIKISESIVFFMLIAVQDATIMCDDSTDCYINTVKYLNRDDVQSINETLNSLSTEKLMTLEELTPVSGVVIRMKNFVSVLSKILESFEDTHYVVVDYKKRSFVPLVVLQYLMSYLRVNGF